MALHLLRKIKRETINTLHDPPQGITYLYLDAKKPWFEKSYVDDKHTRHGDINTALLDGTTGFAIWDDEQGLVKTFDDIEQADFAMRNAKMTLAVQFEVPDEPDAEDVAPAARKGKASAAELGAAAS
jgi:hypothetical protein